jgi:bifunctional DNase/RNase
MIEMSVESVRINLQTQQRVVILKALNEERYQLIWIANAEAYAIAVHLQGTVSPRHLTHDLMKSLVEHMGAKVLRVVISDLRDEIFYANVVLELAGQEVEVDARPSDAIALAVRMPVPIFVTEEVFERSGVTLEHTEETSASETEKTEPQQAQEEATTAQTKPDEAEQQQGEEGASTAQAKTEETEQAQHRSSGSQESAAEGTKLYKEVADVIALEARLARVEEELRKAHERIAELEGEGE